ncbi:hypothetical protein NC653_041736 [Populus alba x Populus x berolinensis]|uniref:Uncharacterized protein n=1 Tax=Populus alba x Populus x berolinensis TaxID=444605 RepID=A0AAD6PPJ9_9ROSI|nr:hypothetical protein NC653_041736 [Populus alba x Populus x berolinensis]
MDEFTVEFGIGPWERESTYRILTDQSCRLARIQGFTLQNRCLKELCLNVFSFVVWDCSSKGTMSQVLCLTLLNHIQVTKSGR